MNELTVKSVDLMGDTVMAAQDSDGTIWVGVKWMCQGMGMSDGQYKRQINNIQNDLLLKDSGSNLILNKGSGEREVFCIKNDYLPMWLAKITITKTIQENNPDLANKILNYQLKAKDILADAFLPKNPQLPSDPMQLLELHYQALKQVDNKVNVLSDDLSTVRKDLEDFKNDMPILGIEETKITQAVKKKGVECLGGKGSNAYKDRSLRGQLYSDMHQQLRREFGVSTYKAIKRNQTDIAVNIIGCYAPPLVLAESIDQANAQMVLDLK